jgi:hypothetical protein
LHELGSIKEDESGDYEYVEIDPSGRYGRVSGKALPFLFGFLNIA